MNRRAFPAAGQTADKGKSRRKKLQSGIFHGQMAMIHIESLDYVGYAYMNRFFEKQVDLPTMVSCWRFWFTREPAQIDWEQDLSANPYSSDRGDVLLIVEAWHYDDFENAQLEQFARTRTIKGVTREQP